MKVADTLNRDDILWAYSLFLGREPESEDVIQHHLKHARDIKNLCENMVASDEFLSPECINRRNINRDINIRCFDVFGKNITLLGVDRNDPYFLSINGKFEATFQKFIEKYIPKDSNAIDIGANIGVTSIILSTLLEDGKVYSVEPAPNVYKILNSNIARNNCKNVKTYNCAISNINDDMEFIENSAYGHIKDNKIQNSLYNNAKSIKINSFTLDDFVATNHINNIKFIKIDTEGFEPMVFSGASELIKRDNPIIYFELNTWCLLSHSNINPINFLHSLFDSFKFIYKEIEENGNVKLCQLMPDDILSVVHDNILFHGSVDNLIVTNMKLDN